jgi:hypothetical protein
LSGDSQTVSEWAGNAAEKDSICEAIKETEKSEAIDAKKEFLFRILAFVGEETVKDRGETSSFL